ncbi:MAG: biotin--[acetyl-CoA-carboxylase] ligase [Pelolinea sp.]|nr:biotin--[acetyl-CoA-carboxylase] ligase [Pelolinea sp.]
MDEQALHNALIDLAIPQIHYFEETDSTNERALALAAQGAHEFTLVIAERQTAGRGRFGRRWETAAGASLAFTLILHPSYEELERLGLFSFLGAVAICLAIEALCETKPQVKWPNDVLLGGQKTAGVLAETTWHGNKLDGLVVGMGINLLPGSVPPASEVMFPATCIQTHCDYPMVRLEFLASALNHLVFWRSKILSTEFLEAYHARLAFIGQQVTLIPTEGKSVNGKLIGIDQSGKIILMMEDGNEIAYPIGDLRLRVAS